ncbi:MAG: hypothetical protein IPJ53_18150 [Saprospiraceae bacterium]|nr:hypothetical protein [Candidatus Vicinibacter affinis]
MADKLQNPLDIVELAASPGSPGSGYKRIYAKSDGQIYAKDSSGNEVLYTTSEFDIVYIIDGGGSVITTGVKGGLFISFPYKIIEWTLASIDPATTSGSIVLDIWTDTQANFPPTVGDTITAAAKPTITTSTKGQSSTLTGWTVSQTAGRWVYFNVDSVTSLKMVAITLKCIRT